MRDITELPHDLFILVISFLPPRDCVRCRAVSRRWLAAFTTDLVSQLLLRWNFPRCRELRLAAAAASLPSSSAAFPRNLQAELRDVAEQRPDWSSTFAEVARRYFYLARGRPRVVDKLELAPSSRENGSIFSFWGVAPWNRFLRLDQKTWNFHYPDPVWSYSQEDGVLVYPAALGSEDHWAPDRCAGHVYRILDLATGHRVAVPFDVRSKHIRRVRMAQGVLIFEWAEALPFHQLNPLEVVHRHFVTAFDVFRKPAATSPGETWTVEFRSEWKLHFLGLPLNCSDRFFSAHTATHYAVYLWQPNRSLYQDDPIEQLAVWDISSPSSYRPSEDPKGDKRPAVARAPSLPSGLWNGQNSRVAGATYSLDEDKADPNRRRRASLAVATAGPQVIRRMAWRELDFYGLRQRVTPQLRCLALDNRNLYVVEEEHRWTDGQHSSLNPPRAHMVRSTAIPVIPEPVSSPQAVYPLATRSATDLTADLEPVALSTIVDGPVNGPIWLDECGANGAVNMNFCVRVVDANGSARPLEASAEHIPDRLRLPLSMDPAGRPWVLGETSSQNAVVSTRWPGCAPCWRHEDFPYLTVAEMVDFAAGVRIIARHRFILEILSVHIRPTVTVKEISAIQVKGDSGTARRRSSEPNAVPARTREVDFPDEMWSELIAKGYIAGDERWVVGEDGRGRITVVRF
ncbi:hypothetical protein N657DRAFT_561994 [Parathielavia appendiculata]|uniref:F-box domain-containing protein n=1 Tax=Parathielavia appendiculata TaxID=2587402 RepID=A0AAN6Z8A4_9PEZI|nr:hypothetical protein N657DRAFT_561994 [Parathielavia appendiculata]